MTSLDSLFFCSCYSPLIIPAIPNPMISNTIQNPNILITYLSKIHPIKYAIPATINLIIIILISLSFYCAAPHKIPMINPTKITYPIILPNSYIYIIPLPRPNKFLALSIQKLLQILQNW